MNEDKKEQESPDWHGKEPFVEFVVRPWPWRNSESYFNPAYFIHRTLFLPDYEPPTKALAKEGPKALMLVRK